MESHGKFTTRYLISQHNKVYCDCSLTIGDLMFKIVYSVHSMKCDVCDLFAIQGTDNVWVCPYCKLSARLFEKIEYTRKEEG